VDFIFLNVPDTVIRSRPDLEKFMCSLREALQGAFGRDTSFPNARYTSSSAGHCAAVAAIVYRRLGGNLVSAEIDNESHWFNRISVQGKRFDIDLTGDQFGRPPIQIAKFGHLYPSTRVRRVRELQDETLRRSELLEQRARLMHAGQRR